MNTANQNIHFKDVHWHNKPIFLILIIFTPILFHERKTVSGRVNSDTVFPIVGLCIAGIYQVLPEKEEESVVSVVSDLG